MKNVLFAGFLAAGLQAVAVPLVEISCDRPDAVYRVGEEVTFTLAAKDADGKPAKAGRFKAGVDNFGTRSIVPKREYDFAEANPVVIKGRLDEPGFLRINVNMPGVTNFLWAVAVSPWEIRPGAPCPPDFDEFWAKAIARYDAEVKGEVTLTRLPDKAPGGELEHFEVRVPALGGRHIQGMLSRPKDLSKGPFPLRFGGKGAGPSSQWRNTSRGCVTLEMNVHYYDVPPDSSKKSNGVLQEKENREWAARYPAKVGGYQCLGIAAGREDYFYYGVILATRRAFHWAAAQPYVDRSDIIYSSTSQGGGFGLYMAAMCPFIRKAAVCVPALADLCGFKAGRMSGWPRLVEGQLDANVDAATANAPYFDAAHFAARVKCPIRFVVGFADDVCPPAAVYAAYNSVRVPDKSIFHGIGMGHLVRQEFYRATNRWLAERQSAMKTPETSGLFERREDPLTGVVSFWLKPGLVDFHQQSLYFTAKSMTDDGRFLVFDACPDPFRKERKGHEDTETRRKYVVDFLKDAVYPVGGASIDGQIPFLDVKTDRLYYVGKDHMSVCVCDLKENPAGETVLCRFPETILEGGRIRRMGTHLTLTRDRKKAFLDYSVEMPDGKRRWFLGLADLASGAMAKWAETPFCSNHAGLNPADDALGICAYEGCWNKTVTTPDGGTKTVPRPAGEVYPRMWLAHADGRLEMQPSKIWNFATHENWTDDGRSFYWGAYHGGTALQDLASGVQRRVCPYWTIHSHLSGDGRHAVFDQWADGDGFRGCAWRVAYHNRATGRCIAIHSRLPAIATKARQSPLHPDAHPQFVCGDRYIVATANDGMGRMNVAVTPVAALAAMTSDPATAPMPRRLPLVWKPGDAASCEVVADCARLRTRGLVPPPPVRADVAWATYGVTALTASGDMPLAVEAFIGGDARPMETVLRFTAPPTATGLVLVVNAPGPFEPLDRDALAVRPAARRLVVGEEIPPSRWDADWPARADPRTVSRRVTRQFLSAAEDDYHPAGYALSDGRPEKGYGWRRCIFYAVVSLWVNALECARLAGDEELERTLVRRFEPYYGPKAGHLPKFKHVDHTIVGALPLEIAILTGDARARALGLRYADMQWERPKPDDPPPPMNVTPFEERLKLWQDGYSDQTRLWIDDAYMMTVLQSQAFRLTGETRYIERAAREMVLYLDRLQLPDGLFHHSPDAPFKWGRGNGWMAAGMPMVLKHLPEGSPCRARIMEGYRRMMAALLAAQAEDGMWNQLVGDGESWEETSATAMFTYAFAAGARRGWLDAARYGAAARKGYLALVQRLDRFGNLPDVCAGTCTKDDRTHYLTRPRINGDPHAQAPLLWICAELMSDGR